MAPSAKEYPFEYLAASAMAAAINYPLWRASAIGQSGFVVNLSSTGASSVALRSLPPALSPYVHAFAPPYKGAAATVLGMTWARAAIFWGSDYGRVWLKATAGSSEPVATLAPPLLVSTVVQCINMPLVRATITIQNPNCTLPTVSAALRDIYHKYGWSGLWHGTSAGILKTVPKYCTAVVVKDVMEAWLPPADPSSPTYESDRLWRSAYKSAVAGTAGAALTNPLDVIRNEMFKTNYGLLQAVRHLKQEMGYAFLVRGLGKNMVAVAIPLGCTIFFTDALIQLSSNNRSKAAQERTR